VSRAITRQLELAQRDRGSFRRVRLRRTQRLNALVDRGEPGFFGRGRDAGTDGIEIDVGHRGEQPGLIEQRLRTKPPFPEAALAVIFDVGASCKVFVAATPDSCVRSP